MSLEYLLVDPNNDFRSSRTVVYCHYKYIHCFRSKAAPDTSTISKRDASCCCVNPHYRAVPCYWAAPHFHFYPQSPTLVETLDSRSSFVGVSNVLAVLHNHDDLH